MKQLTYAHVVGDSIIEFKQLDESLYDSWVESQNPKAEAYRLVVFSPPPEVSASQVAVSSFEINPTTVDQIWDIRNKTPDELRKIWTSYQFLLRFTFEERAAFRAAAAVDPVVADFQQLQASAQEVISDDPTTLMGMAYLVQSNLLTQQRMDEILGG